MGKTALGFRGRYRRRRGQVLAAVVIAATALCVPTACANRPAPAGPASSAAPPSSQATDGAFSGLVDIGDGRKLYLDCQGTGTPTVFIIPGKGSYAQAWNYVVPAGDPIRSSPYDLINQAKLEPSPTAVMPTVAKATHVCAYDRPNTRPDPPDQSTPVAQPHTIAQDVDDIVKLVAAAHLSGPFVVVAHSYGGLLADLLARTHPDLVAGLVFVDPTSEFLPKVGTPEQNAAFAADFPIPAAPDGEGIVAEDAFHRVAAAPPLPAVPAVVLSSDKFPPPDQLRPDNYTQAQIQQANDMLAQALGTTANTHTDSGHSIMLYSPQLVADAIVSVVDKVRG
jgi:pimeloyl-ACP methyl ester carboxylesterase